MPDQGDRDEFGYGETTSNEAGSNGAAANGDHATVIPVAFGSGLRLDDEFDLDHFVGAGEAEDPIDFSRVHADDMFLDALGAAVRADTLDGSFHGDLADHHLVDDELAALLSSWRDEVDAEPIGDIVDTKLAIATVFAARARKRRRPRLLVPFAAAAAVLAIAFTGASLAAQDAVPGDPLWGLTKVLYADHARSVEAAANVRQDLSIAQTALAEGKLAEAKSKLEEAQKDLSVVATEDGKADLTAQHADLMAKLPGSPADGVIPPPSANPSTADTEPSTTAPTTTPTGTSSPSSPPATTTTPSTPPSTTTEVQTTTPTAPLTEGPRVEPDVSPTGPASPGEPPGSP
ncbi:anti-sigma-D factor RsdA [Actinokineospora sp.]|uniref:anti-sigma-D factor RsdA n=1 Tax=Actinokineospora sp. TaxID=1872133 RepID=UPI0040378078